MSQPPTNFCVTDDKSLKKKGLLKCYQPHTKAIYSLAITPDRVNIVTASLDNTIKIFDLLTGKFVRSLEGHEEDVHSIALSEDGGHLVSASEDSSVKIWKLDTGNLIRNLTGHTGAALSAIFTPNMQYVISTAEDKLVKIWNWNTKKIIRTLKGHESAVNSVAISPDGKYIATSGMKIIRVWKWGTNVPEYTLEGHKFGVTSLAISKEGDYLVSGSLDKTVKIWSMETGKIVKSLEDHKGSVNSVAISDDNKYIASGAGDNSVMVYELEGNKKWGPFCMGAFVQSVKFIPDTHLIASADYHGQVCIWDFLEESISLEAALKPKVPKGETAEAITKKLNIFVSYATSDSEHFEISKVSKMLMEYPDIDAVLYWEEYMEDDIMVYMNDNLGIADIVMVFCSPASCKSEAVRLEWMTAVKMKKKVIPVFEDEADIPPLLTTKLGMQFQKNDMKVFITRLYDLIKKKTREKSE
jgi:WD40 repeat protein